MDNATLPFHMRQDNDADGPILPQGHAEYPDTGQGSFVDVKTIDRPYSADYAQYQSLGEGLASTATLVEDGRIVVSLDLHKKLPDLPDDYALEVKEFAVDTEAWKTRDVPRLSIVIMIVGSRGDVQPYVALGKRLVQDGHRVRIATHETFRKFVRSAGLEFFNIGGDPQQLMSYMVKNPGLIPGIESLTNGDIGRKRDMLREMINGCWQACYEPDDETGEAFSADAIISNPPAFGHIHCAEALGIPLLLSFTMPWSPTSSFPHPLVNIKASNAERGLTNYLSYAMAELLTWQGIGDIVNSFRVKALGLRPLSLRSGPGMADRLKVPFTYCLSPSLVPKPRDWKSHIDIVGFYFMPSDTQYRPPSDLLQFLDAGPLPVYIGFGSVVVDDPEGMSNIIVQAVQNAGVRAILFAGWGGLGGLSSSPNILILGKESNVPHDWLFTRVAAVVHHGGAGTTAAGLACGRPTVVVPFFGDQLFWGLMVNRAGAGPPPIPQKELSVQNLTSAIRYAMTPAATQAAKRLGDQIGTESGVERGVESFYRHLPLLNMRCDLVPSGLAVWWSTKYCLRLSALAAQVLVDAKLLSYDKLDTHRPKEYASQADISDPVTGGASAIFWTITNYYTGIAKIFYSPVNGVIKTTTAIPKGIADILFSVQEGFSNLPKLYGSEVRAPGKVTNFKSGLKEGGKGLFYGYYDGITGLVREPLEGAKKEGVVGAIKGSARSFVNVTMRPAAGALGLVTHPLNGAWKSLQGSWARKQDKQQETTRMAQGLAAVRSCSIEQRRHILDRFVEARKTTAERRKKYEAEARETLCHESQPKANDSGPSKVPERTSAQSSQGSVDELDAQFERDLEMAKQLSLAESSSS